MIKLRMIVLKGRLRTMLPWVICSMSGKVQADRMVVQSHGGVPSKEGLEG